MVGFNQVWFSIQHSLPYCPYTSSIFVCRAWAPVHGIEALILILERVLNCRYDLIIGPILLPSQEFFFLVGGTENNQMVPNKENMDNDQTVQSHSHARQPLQPHTYVQEHCPGETGLPSSVFQAVLTRFPIDSLDFLTVVNEHNSLCILKDGRHYLPCRWHHLSLLWRRKRGMFPLHKLSFSLEVVDPTLISGEETFKRMDLLQKVSRSPAIWPAAFDESSKAVAPTQRKPSTCQVRCA